MDDFAGSFGTGFGAAAVPPSASASVYSGGFVAPQMQGGIGMALPGGVGLAFHPPGPQQQQQGMMGGMAGGMRTGPPQQQQHSAMGGAPMVGGAGSSSAAGPHQPGKAPPKDPFGDLF